VTDRSGELVPPSTEPRPVVFIHGLWVHASAWEPWQDLFSHIGYQVHAPGWVGDSATAAQTRSDSSRMTGLGIADLASGYQEFIGSLPRRPIVVGHSFGGLIAQKLLSSGHAEAVVALSPAPIRGADKLPWPQIRSALPVLSRPWNKDRVVALSQRQFRYGFGNAVSGEESRRLFDHFAIPGPGRPVFELTGAKKDPASPTAVDTSSADRGPLLIIGAGQDHMVPEVVSHQAYGLYAGSAAVTDYHSFPDRGHALTMDARWEEVAQYVLKWLGEQQLGPVAEDAGTAPLPAE
jgi:non-heme chloroperoxidase